MMDVPPPMSILNPFCPSWMRGMKPTSWIPVMAQSRSQPEKADLILRGIDWVKGCLTKYREYAAAYGVTSKGSLAQTPAMAHPVTLRTVLPHASRVVRPTEASIRMMVGVSGSGM